MKQKKNQPQQSKQHDNSLYRSEEFWSRSTEEIIKEAKERQMKARAYEAEYAKMHQD